MVRLTLAVVSLLAVLLVGTQGESSATIDVPMITITKTVLGDPSPCAGNKQVVADTTDGSLIGSRDRSGEAMRGG